MLIKSTSYGRAEERGSSLWLSPCSLYHRPKSLLAEEKALCCALADRILFAFYRGLKFAVRLEDDTRFIYASTSSARHTEGTAA